MTSHLADDILDDLFHGCALAAYLEQARLQQTWPDSEQTRRRAFRLFEEQLARSPRHNRIDVSEPETLPCKASHEEPNA